MFLCSFVAMMITHTISMCGQGTLVTHNYTFFPLKHLSLVIYLA